MKKIISLFLLLISIGAVSAKSKLKGDIDAGIAFNYLKLYEDNITLEPKRLGAYAAGTLEFNDYFGLFLDDNFLFLIEKNDFDFNMVCSSLIGVCGIVPVTDKFKIKIGLGYDECVGFGYATGKNLNWFYSPYNTTYYFTDYKSFGMDALMGIGAKLSGTVLFNDYVGMNFGIKGSYYFGGLSETVYIDSDKDTDVSWHSSKCFSITTELGVTFHLERRGNSGKVKNNDLSAKDDIEL